jgi:hypothetical protein
MTSTGTEEKARQRNSAWLTLIRIGWIVVTLLILGLFLSGIPGRYSQLVQSADERSLTDLGLSVEAYARAILALNLILILAHNIIAAVIFWRRRDDWMALFVSYALITNGAVIPLAAMRISGLLPQGWEFSVGVITSIGLISSVILLYLFPNGRFIPGWTRFLALSWIFLVLFAIFSPESPLGLPAWPLLLQVLGLVFFSGTGVFSQVFRYLNVSTQLQRQQSKWALFGLTAAVLGPFLYFLPFVIVPSLSAPAVPNLLYQRVGSSFFTFSFLSRLGVSSLLTFAGLVFPLSFAIAVLRYRLWDIDILINRALVYSSLTGLLALIYFSSVILLQNLLRVFTGEGQPEIVTVFSTLSIAALFVPLQRRVQAGIDRRFYRKKYDAVQTLASFSATLRDEVDLNLLSERLLAVVEETMQPDHVSLWLRNTQTNRNS